MYIVCIYSLYISVLIILVSKIRRTYWQISWTALKTATWILRIRMPFSNLNFKSTIYIVYILTIHQRSPIQDAEPLLYHQRERWPQAHHIQMSKLVLLLFSSDPDPTCLNGNIILFSSWTKYKQESTNVSFKWSGSDFLSWAGSGENKFRILTPELPFQFQFPVLIYADPTVYDTTDRWWPKVTLCPSCGVQSMFLSPGTVSLFLSVRVWFYRQLVFKSVILYPSCGMHLIHLIYNPFSYFSLCSIEVVEAFKSR